MFSFISSSTLPLWLLQFLWFYFLCGVKLWSYLILDMNFFLWKGNTFITTATNFFVTGFISLLFMVMRLFPPLIAQQKQSVSSSHLYVLCFQPLPDDSMEQSFQLCVATFSFVFVLTCATENGLQSLYWTPSRNVFCCKSFLQNYSFFHIKSALHRFCVDPSPSRP